MNTTFDRVAAHPQAATPPRMPVLSDIVRDIQSRLQTTGISLADMRKAGSLETDVIVPQLVAAAGNESRRIERLEGERSIVARKIVPRNETKFRWFIDGSQKTLPVWRIGVVPIVVGVAVVGILERDDQGSCHLLGETLVERTTWFIPTRTQSAELNQLIDTLRDAGQDVRDPLDRFTRSPDDLAQYHALAGNYSHLLFYAQDQAGKVRGAIEQELVRFWDVSIRRNDPGSWLVVDGRLQSQVPNAVGLVKDPSSQHLHGDEAAALYSLDQGHRTTAYQLHPPKRGDDEADAELRNQIFSMWYQRMWAATGLDARHALVRIETSNEVWESEVIDDIATWLIAERLPRPTGDARWPTLLYPIHLLELMLKRRINAMTVGWPGQ